MRAAVAAWLHEVRFPLQEWELGGSVGKGVQGLDFRACGSQFRE